MNELEDFDTAAVADVMSAMGLGWPALSPSIRPLGTAVMAGPALCAFGSEEDSGPAIETFELDRLVYPGCIVIISTGPCDRGAIIGANMVSSMVRSGAVGIVLDGGVRDTQALTECSRPIWCRFTSPVSAHRAWRYRALDVPVRLPGIKGEVVIHPGDYIIADADGVCVIPAAHTRQVLADARIHFRMENEIARAISAGESREDATRRLPRLKHVRPLTGTDPDVRE